MSYLKECPSCNGEGYVKNNIIEDTDFRKEGTEVLHSNEFTQSTQDTKEPTDALCERCNGLGTIF